MSTIKLDSIDAQNISRDFVRTEVYANIGQIMDYILRKSYEDVDAPFSYEDLQLEVDPSEWGAVQMKEYIEYELGATWEDATGTSWEEIVDDGGDMDDEDALLHEARNYIRDNASPREIYEWWVISDYLLFQLESEGEIVAHLGGNLNVWGRQATGQAIYMDGVIQKIALARYEYVKSLE